MASWGYEFYFLVHRSLMRDSALEDEIRSRNSYPSVAMYYPLSYRTIQCWSVLLGEQPVIGIHYTIQYLTMLH